MKRTRMTLLIIACLMMAILALVGCGQSPTSDSTSSTPSSSAATNSSSSTAKSDLALSVIGSGDTTVQVKNETGYDIIGVRIKPVSQIDYGSENSFDGFTFENGETVDLSFTQEKATSSYDVLLLTSEDSKIAVRNIELANARDIVFHFEEGVGYISYTDPKTGALLDSMADAIDAEENAATVPSDLETQKG